MQPKLLHCTPRRFRSKKEEDGEQKGPVEHQQSQRRDQPRRGQAGRTRAVSPWRPRTRPSTAGQPEHGQNDHGEDHRQRGAERPVEGEAELGVDDPPEGDAAHPAHHLRRHEVAHGQHEGERRRRSWPLAATAARRHGRKVAQAVPPRSAEASIRFLGMRSRATKIGRMVNGSSSIVERDQHGGQIEQQEPHRCRDEPDQPAALG